jgi:quinol monooxygenase YgiN
MIIVAGHLVVDADRRDAYLSGCVDVVRQARDAPGCLDFSITADVLDPRRVDVYERWESAEAVAAFRGSGPSDEQAADLRGASVSEYDVTRERSLT